LAENFSKFVPSGKWNFDLWLFYLENAQNTFEFKRQLAFYSHIKRGPLSINQQIFTKTFIFDQTNLFLLKILKYGSRTDR
jgi:hypothetical protein